MAIADLIDGGGFVTESYGCGSIVQVCSCAMQPGIDIAAPMGAITRALGYGIVQSTGLPCWAGPQAVIVASGDVAILYAHLDSALVTPGQAVFRGTPIGRIGMQTGQAQGCGGVATGPHLHYQVNPAGQADFAAWYCAGINPTPYLDVWPGVPPITPVPALVSPTPIPVTVVGTGLVLGGAALMLLSGGLLEVHEARKLRSKRLGRL